MKILWALCFPLRRPLRLAALALAQSLFLWLLIGAIDATYGYPGKFKAVVSLLLFCGTLLCNAFWLHGSSVASLQGALAGQNSLAAQRAAHFKPRGIGPGIASLVLFVYFALFLALAGMPEHLSRIVWHLRVMTPLETRALVTSHVLAIGLGTLFSLMFFVSLAGHAAEGIGLRIDVRATGPFHSHKNLAATLRYLMRQLVLLGMAAAGFNIGLELIYANMPSGAGAPLEDLFATAWWVIAIFAGSAVVHYFWHASLHLLADYVVETGT